MRVVAASPRLPGELAELGDKEGRARVECERLAVHGTGVEVRVEGVLDMLDLSPGDLRWLSSDSTWISDGRAQRVAMESALTICCRTVMKKRICT